MKSPLIALAAIFLSPLSWANNDVSLGEIAQLVNQSQAQFESLGVPLADIQESFGADTLSYYQNPQSEGSSYLVVQSSANTSRAQLLLGVPVNNNELKLLSRNSAYFSEMPAFMTLLKRLLMDSELAKRALAAEDFFNRPVHTLMQGETTYAYMPFSFTQNASPEDINALFASLREDQKILMKCSSLEEMGPRWTVEISSKSAGKSDDLRYEVCHQSGKCFNYYGWSQEASDGKLDLPVMKSIAPVDVPGLGSVEEAELGYIRATKTSHQIDGNDVYNGMLLIEDQQEEDPSTGDSLLIRSNIQCLSPAILG